jgi:predicted O-linked N-acetylglucosamine transferase (SPINDLY family)
VPAVSSQPYSVTGAYQAATAFVQQGHPSQAEPLCRDILREHPDHADAMLLLGIIQMQTGRSSQAAVSFRDAIQSRASRPIGHALLGDALLELKEPREALDSYDRALQLTPRLVPALFGRGNALLDLQRPLEAIAAYESLLELQPNNPEVLFNRGNALLALDRHSDAVDSFDRAIRLQADYAAAHNNRGSALIKMGLAQRALESFDAAIAIDSRFDLALGNRGSALRLLARPDEALRAFDRALELNPDNVEALWGRGDVLLQVDRDGHSDALAYFDRALERRPDFARALRSRGDVLLSLGRPEAAVQSFAALLRADSAFDYAAGALLHAQRSCADWSVRVPAASPDALHRSVLAGKRADSPFSFLSVVDDPAAQLQCARTFVADRCPPAAAAWTGARYVHDRLRVAYVSGDFREHAVSYLLCGVFERHDRLRFETIGISLSPEEHSPAGQRIKGAFSRFIEVGERGDRAVADLLRDLEIDIAVDLTGFTEGMRPQIFAARPAPIQVNYLGFPGTLGGPYFDYILADRFVIPPEQARHYAERVVSLPDCFQANDSQRPVSEHPAAREEVGLAQGSFVFCCFNNSYKLNPEMFDIWMRLLRRIPESVLWTLGASEQAAIHLRREAAERDVDPHRIVCADRAPYPVHLRRLQLADLFLDTLPFNAGATASDALWAGLPVLTCAGRSFAARMAGSLLHAVGLPELVTQDLESYEAKALELAQQPGLLSTLRRHLRETRQDAPLFDADRFRRNLESAYLQMWQRHQRGEIPASFAVEFSPSP